MACLAMVAGCAAPASDVYPVAPYQAPAAHGHGGTQQAPPYQRGRASYYSDKLAGRSTASGEPYVPAAYTAAHRTLPFGAVVDVARADGRHVVVRVNDRGPYAHGRIIDLSRRAATDLGMIRAGVVDVVLRVVWMPPRRR